MPATQKVTSKVTDDDLLRQIEAAENTKAVCDKNIKQAKAELLARRKDEVKALLKAKDEPFGDVSIIVGNHKVKINTPKKVDWDQTKLKTIYDQIVDDGANPDVYIKTEYSVSETAFKSWDSDTQDFFRDARTVTAGNPGLKIIKDGEE